MDTRLPDLDGSEGESGVQRDTTRQGDGGWGGILEHALDSTPFHVLEARRALASHRIHDGAGGGGGGEEGGGEPG